jgi:hypothetical protein
MGRWTALRADDPFMLIARRAAYISSQTVHGDAATWMVAGLVVGVVAIGKTAPVKQMNSNRLLQRTGRKQAAAE